MGTLEPSPRTPVADAGAETERALSEPVGSPRLRDLVQQVHTESLDRALRAPEVSFD